jgi:putative NADPH-quinone reductase
VAEGRERGVHLREIFPPAVEPNRKKKTMSNEKKRTLLILASPTGSFGEALADAYRDGAQSAGHDVRVIALNQLAFDPILRQGYREIQTLEPDLLAAQESIQWAQHLVFVYPLWWGTMPALLKGFIDRIFLPGFAFKYRPNSLLSDKLLSGRSAQLIVTMDTPPWFFRLAYCGKGHRIMKNNILEFCGIRPVSALNFGPIKTSDANKRQQWLKQVRDAGSHAGASTNDYRRLVVSAANPNGSIPHETAKK